MATKIEDFEVELSRDETFTPGRILVRASIVTETGARCSVVGAPLELLRAVFEHTKAELTDPRHNAIAQMRVIRQLIPGEQGKQTFDQFVSRLYGMMAMCEAALAHASKAPTPGAPAPLAAAAEMAAQDRQLLSLLNFILRECRVMRGDLPALTNHRERTRVMDMLLRGCDGIRQRVRQLMTALWGDEVIDAREQEKPSPPPDDF